MMAGKVVGLEFEIISKLDSYFFNDSSNPWNITYWGGGHWKGNASG